MKMILIYLSFSAISIWALLGGLKMEAWAAWFCLIFFGGGGAIYTFIIGRQIITGKYDIILDASGLNDYSTLANRPVLWSEVVSIDPVIDQVHAAGATTDITYIQVTLQSAVGSQSGYENIFIEAKSLKMPPEQVVDIMRQYHQRAINSGVMPISPA